MLGIERRSFIAGLLLLPLSRTEAFARSSTQKENAWRIHRRRNLERRDQLRYRNQIEPQRSRPVPPTSPGSSTVPNR